MATEWLKINDGQVLPYVLKLRDLFNIMPLLREEKLDLDIYRIYS